MKFEKEVSFCEGQLQMPTYSKEFRKCEHEKVISIILILEMAIIENSLEMFRLCE